MPYDLWRQSFATFLRAETLRGSPNAGLLIRRGVASFDPDDDGGLGRIKADQIGRITGLQPSALYRAAFRRWKSELSAARGYKTLTLRLSTRLYIGATRDNPIECGVLVGHTYGMPMIPGSSLKGVMRAVATDWLGSNDKAVRYLFGAGGDDPQTDEIGAVTVLDAWWDPDCGKFPFVAEVVTPHHREYYGSAGAVEATDFDSPVPAPQIAVQGSFLFALEGPGGWRELAEKLLVMALTSYGVGSKTTSGYGLFDPPTAS